MNKKDFLIGFLVGLAASGIGSYCFITFWTPYHFIDGIQIMKSQGNLGKLITLGSILNLIVFALFLKSNKEMMAKGVIMALICLTLFTLLL